MLLCVGAFAQGINFRSVTFAEALQQSAAEKKPVFLDCYTTWCGPCKYMADEVFTLKEAGDYFNKNFVSIKIDMEKGEGIELAKKYAIKAYPTFLVLDAEGTELNRVVGGSTLADFIVRIEVGLNSKKSLAELESKYESGSISKKDLTTYWLLMREGGSESFEKAQQVGDKIYGMLSKSDKMKAAYWPLVRAKVTSPDSEGMDFVLANRKALSKSNGKEAVDQVIFRSFCMALNMLVNVPVSSEQVAKLPAIVTKLKAIDLADEDQLLVMAELADARARKDIDTYLGILKQNYTRMPMMAITVAFTGTRGMLVDNADAKAYYKRIHDLATEILANPAVESDESYKPSLVAMTANYKRLANVGVYWDHFDSLDAALAQAKAESTPVFLDCYTTWCGPCKHMTENVFTQEEVGDFFNARFINIKIDMEAGEGPEVAKKFGVRAYPTFVVINPDGTMRHVIVGGADGPAFIEMVKEAFDDNKALSVVEKKYNDGERGREFLFAYMNALKDAYNPKAGEVALTIFESLSDAERLSADNWVLFEDPELASPNSEIGKYLIANLDGFRKSVGKEKVDERVASPYGQSFMMVIAGRDQKTTAADIDRMVSKIKTAGLEQAPMLTAYANVAKLTLKGDKAIRNYKSASKGLTPEENPYINVYMRFHKDLTPAQVKEWKAWGEELAAKGTDPRFKQYMERLLAQ